MPYKNFSTWLLAALSITLLLCRPVLAAETLRVLTWPGYADSDLVKVFERRHGVRVEVNYVSSDEVLREKISANQGGNFDVFAANTAELQFFISQRLAAPLQLANIPNTANQLARFRDLQNLSGIHSQGKVYGIPYTYSEMGLIYDRKQMPQAPTSMAAMWDPKYRGRVLAFNSSSHNFSISALLLEGSAFHIPKEKFNRVARHLIDLRRNVLAFYTTPEESVELFREHSVALLFANYGRQQYKMLRDAGMDVGYAIPDEGALAWLDCWVVTSGARNQRLAETWINYMLEAGVSTELTKRQDLANTITDDKLEKVSDKIIWLEPVENANQRAALWVSIMSGEQPEKMLRQ